MKSEENISPAEARDGHLTYCSFLEALGIEREYQRNKWGDIHDQNHTFAEWVMLLSRLLGEMGDTFEHIPRELTETRVQFLQLARRQAIKIAATCNALVDTIDVYTRNSQKEVKNNG